MKRQCWRDSPSSDRRSSFTYTPPCFFFAHLLVQFLLLPHVPHFNKDSHALSLITLGFGSSFSIGFGFGLGFGLGFCSLLAAPGHAAAHQSVHPPASLPTPPPSSLLPSSSLIWSCPPLCPQPSKWTGPYQCQPNVQVVFSLPALWICPTLSSFFFNLHLFRPFISLQSDQSYPLVPVLLVP